MPTTVNLTDGSDNYTGTGDDELVNARNGSDTVRGAGGRDTLFGEGGNDWLFGDAGDDVLFGGAGSDVLEGGVGNDMLDGEGGEDTLRGGAGDDRLNGDNGGDYLDGGVGRDLLSGGNGDDRFVFEAGDFAPGVGPAGIDGANGDDTLLFEQGVVADFRSIANNAVSEVEILSLEDGDASREALILTTADVLALDGGRPVRIDGDSGDVVTLLELTNTGATRSINGLNYLVYRGGGATAWVDPALRVNTVPTVNDQTFSVNENSTAVGNVAATDPDPGDALTYTIVGSSSAGVFTINASTGALNVAAGQMLNYEAAASHMLTVRVTDGGGLSDDAILTVNVTDVNEAPTVNDQAFSVAENSGAGASVGMVVATDPDTTAPNNSLSYSITGGAAGQFVIDAASGAISVAMGATLGYESQPEYTLTVQVTDQDGAGLADTAMVTVSLTDVNEAPTFSPDIYDFSVDENSGAGTSVGMVVVTDPDTTAPNNSLSYSITGGAAGQFVIDPASGVISVADGAMLDYEALSEYTLTVQVTDQAGAGLFDTTTVNISLNDDADEGGGACMPPTAPPASLADLDGCNGFVVAGSETNGLSGFAVAAADINGDGFADLLIGSNDYADYAGQVYVIFGSASDFPALLTIADDAPYGDAGLVIHGAPGSYDFFGRSVASAGDVNGDDVEDFIVGAPDPFGLGGTGGRAYVIFGNSAGFGTTLDLAMLDGGNGIELTSSDAGSFFGHAVSSAGDINGDGYDDLLVGAPHYSSPTGAVFPEPGFDLGRAYIIFGQAGGFVSGTLNVTTDLTGANGFAITGVDDATGVVETGFSVAAVGNVGGSGADDILIGAPFSDPDFTSQGIAYLVYGDGGYGAELDLATLSASGGVAIMGAGGSDRAGIAVSGAGDINGDGDLDFIVASTPVYAVDSSTAYVIYGGQTFGDTLELSSLGMPGGTLGFAIEGLAGGTPLALCSVGDMNGDGLGDIAIGAGGAGDEGEGAVYVVFGSSTGLPGVLTVDDLESGDYGFALYGLESNDHFGSSLAAGDVNGDAFADLIVGAPNANYNAGETYVIYGGPYDPMA